MSHHHVEFPLQLAIRIVAAATIVFLSIRFVQGYLNQWSQPLVISEFTVVSDESTHGKWSLGPPQSEVSQGIPPTIDSETPIGLQPGSVVFKDMETAAYEFVVLNSSPLPMVDLKIDIVPNREILELFGLNPFEGTLDASYPQFYNFLLMPHDTWQFDHRLEYHNMPWSTPDPTVQEGVAKMAYENWQRSAGFLQSSEDASKFRGMMDHIVLQATWLGGQQTLRPRSSTISGKP